MKKSKLYVMAVVLGVMFLSGCDDEEDRRQALQSQTNQAMLDERYVNQQTPQVVQGTPGTVVINNETSGGGHSSGAGEFLMGAMVGHALSNSGNNSRVEHHYYDNSSRNSYNNRSSYSAPRTYSNSSSKTRTSYTAPKKSYPSSSSYKPSKSYSSSRSSFSSRSSSSSRRR